MQRAVGAWGAVAVSFAVIVAALSSANATMITGARSNYALGRDVPLFGFLGDWNQDQHTPRAAFLLQGGIALLLVAFGALARSGFEAMVAYTAPVFWLILFGTGASLMVLRRREPITERPFRVPLYPVVPLLFCGVAAYMLYSSVAYAGRGALLGVAVMLAGHSRSGVAGRAQPGGHQPSSRTRHHMGTLALIPCCGLALPGHGDHGGARLCPRARGAGDDGSRTAARCSLRSHRHHQGA